MPSDKGEDGNNPSDRGEPKPFEFGIYYLIPLEGDDNRQSPFQGFSVGVYGAASLLRYFRGLPASANELALDTDQRIRLACAGMSAYQILPVNLQHLEELHVTVATPFFFVLSWTSSDSQVRTWIEAQDIRPFHITNTPGVGDSTLDDFSEETVRRLLMARTRELLGHEGLREQAESLLSRIRVASSPSDVKFPRTSHNALWPNECTLERMGRHFSEDRHFDARQGDPQVVEAIRRSTEAILGCRERCCDSQLPSLTPSIILTTTGRSRAMEKLLLKRLQAGVNPTIGKAIGRAWRWHRDQTGYFHLGEPDFISDPITQLVTDFRTAELDAYSAALAMRAASEMSAVIRLPPLAQRAWQTAADLAQCHAANSGQRTAKLAKLKGTLRQELKDGFPPDLFAFIDGAPLSIRLISDLPLEWISASDGQPMMFRHVCSRIPPVPGNLMFQTTLPKPRVYLPANAFEKLLVVRSFQRKDPLRNVLVDTLLHLCRTARIDLTIRDVHSLSEFRDALNAFDGAWFMFDGHGEPTQHSSNLVVGKDSIDPWELRRTARVPPIAIPIACNVHPIATQHSSAANAFLSAGARTVFGSLLQIDGTKSALFAARLARAATELVPLLFSSGRTEVSWAELFSIVHQGQFVTELAMLLRNRFPLIDRAALAHAETHCRAMTLLRDRRWYSECLLRFAGICEYKLQDFQRLIDNEFPILDCSLYIQVGDPESIVILDTSGHPDPNSNGVHMQA